MTILSTRPLFVLAIAVMVGIAVASQGAPAQPGAWLIGAGIAGVAGAALVAAGGRAVFLGALIAALAVGVVRDIGATRVAPGDISRFAPAAYARIDGFISSDPDVRPGRASFYLSAVSVAANGSVHRVSGEVSVLVSLARAGGFDFHDGERIELIGSLEPPSGLANPGLDSWAEYLARRGVWCECHVRRATSVALLPGGQPNPFRAAAWSARAALLRSLTAILPRTDAAVLAGVLLGLRTDLPADLLAAFVATGTIHILATAGLHIGILYKLLLDGLSWLTVPRKLAALGTIAALWLYDLMAGGRIAVTRAVIMATIYLVAIVIERTPDALNSLGGAALIVLFASPTQLFDAGFQASFAAVLLIILMMPVWDRLWAPALAKPTSTWGRKAARLAVELTGLTLFAQAGAAPVVARAFNVVALLGSIANLIVVPLLFYLIPAGLLLAVLGVWLPTPAAFLAHWLVSPAIRFIVFVVTGIAHLPGASTVIASPAVVQLAAYYAIAAAVFLWAEKWLWRTRTAGAEEA